MKGNAESALYPGVTVWLACYLKGRYPKCHMLARDTHRMELSAFLRRERLHHEFKDYDAYEIQVDVTGIVWTRDPIRLAFVECKVAPIVRIPRAAVDQTMSLGMSRRVLFTDSSKDLTVFLAVKAFPRITAENIHIVCSGDLVPEFFELNRRFCVTFRP